MVSARCQGAKPPPRPPSALREDLRLDWASTLARPHVRGERRCWWRGGARGDDGSRGAPAAELVAARRCSAETTSAKSLQESGPEPGGCSPTSSWGRHRVRRPASSSPPRIGSTAWSATGASSTPTNECARDHVVPVHTRPRHGPRRRLARRARPVSAATSSSRSERPTTTDACATSPCAAWPPAGWTSILAIIPARRGRGRGRGRPRPPRPAPALALRVRDLPRQLTRGRARPSCSSRDSADAGVCDPLGKMVARWSPTRSSRGPERPPQSASARPPRSAAGASGGRCQGVEGLALNAVRGAPRLSVVLFVDPSSARADRQPDQELKIGELVAPLRGLLRHGMGSTWSFAGSTSHTMVVDAPPVLLRRARRP